MLDHLAIVTVSGHRRGGGVDDTTGGPGPDSDRTEPDDVVSLEPEPTQEEPGAPEEEPEVPQEEPEVPEEPEAPAEPEPAVEPEVHPALW
jgi:hypothetical protein